MESSGEMNKEIRSIVVVEKKPTGSVSGVREGGVGRVEHVSSAVASGEWMDKVAKKEEQMSVEYKNEWMNQVSGVAREYRRLTGGDFAEYVLRKVEPGTILTGEDRERQLAEAEFESYLKREKRDEVVGRVVSEEKARLTEGRETPWQVPVVAQESWEDRKNVRKSPPKGGSGVEIKPVYELREDEREARMEREMNQTVQEEVARQESGQSPDWESAAKKILEAAKFWGIVGLVTDLAEELPEYLRDRGAKHEHPGFKDFMQWHEHKGQEEKKADKGKDASPVESENSNNLSDITYAVLRDRISKLSRKESLEQGEAEEMARLKDEKLRRVAEITRLGFYDMSQPSLERAINQVLTVSRPDNVERNIRELASAAEDQARGSDDYRTDARYNGVVYGVLREEVDKVLGDIYDGMTDAELSAKNINRDRNKLEMRLLDRKRAGIVSIRNPGGLLAMELSDQELEDIYNRHNIPGADEALRYRRARKEDEERQDAARKREEERRNQPQANTPDRENKQRKETELQGVKQMLLTALIEGGWQSSGAGGDRETIRRWIAREGAHAETSLIKAQAALVDWVDKLGSGDKFGAKVEVALLIKGIGSEEMEALENSEVLIKAKKSVLTETGFNMDSGVSAAEIRDAIKTLKYSNAELRKRGMSDNDREEARRTLRRVLNKRQEFITRANPSAGGEEPVTFWDLKQNEYRGSVNKLFESTARALGKTEVDDEVRAATMTAIRQIQHSGLWNMFHTSYAPHPFISSDMTQGFHPADGYLTRLDSNDKDFVTEKPGHFRLAKGNREKFIRRESELGVYDMSRASEVPGYPGMTWNEMVLPPENLISYALETNVLSGREALWDRWARVDPITDRETDFFKMGPLFVANNKRKVAARLSQMLDVPIDVSKLVKPGSPILKDVGDQTMALMKDYGLLIGTTKDIRDRMNEVDNQEVIDDFARFALTRRLVFMVDQGALGKLDLGGRKFSTKWLATAMRGERIVSGTEDMDHKSEGLFSDEFWDYKFSTRAEGWGIVVSGEDAQSAGSVKVDLTNTGMIRWLDGHAGLDFGSDLMGRFQDEITTWFEQDDLARVVAGLDAIGDSGPTITSWENMTPRQAFERRRASSAVMNKKTISNATVGGLGQGRRNEMRHYRNRPELAKATVNMRYIGE